MPSRHVVRCLPMLLLVCAPACQSFYSYRPMTIQVRDAETGQPVSGAVVHISYPLLHPSQAPYDSVDATGPDGLVHLRAAPSGPAGVLVEAKAHGYMPDQQTLSIDQVEQTEKAGWFEDVSKRSPTLTIQVYAEPRPQVELVLPVGFRGVVDVQVIADSKNGQTRGERKFMFTVPITGKIEMVGPALLSRVAPLDYHARYPDGQVLTADAKGIETGFWGLNADGNHLTFLVGTRDEFEAKRREALANDAAPRGPATMGNSSGGRHGGRGGRGGRGGGQTDASTATSGQ